MNLQSAQAILIVDDDPPSPTPSRACCSSKASRSMPRSVRRTALKSRPINSPDKIILELRMPILSALQFLEHLRETPALWHTPVAIVTGDYFVDDGTTSKIEALGASVLFKPICWKISWLSLGT